MVIISKPQNFVLSRDLGVTRGVQVMYSWCWKMHTRRADLIKNPAIWLIENLNQSKMCISFQNGGWYIGIVYCLINSLLDVRPSVFQVINGRSGYDFKNAILTFSLVLLIVQIMAWYRQITSHYPAQCWPRSMAPYDATRPQLRTFSAGCHTYFS